MAKPKQKKQTKAQKNSNKGFDLNSWLEKHFTKLTLISVTLAGIISLFLFDLKIGVGGDDSAYIKRAFDLVTEGKFPAFQGPVYPMLLSVFVLFFGINIPLLKFLSFVFMLVAIYFFFKAYHKKVETIILVLLGFITSVNSMLLFFSSQTYVESFFFMLLSINVYLFFRYLIDKEDAFISKVNWKGFVIISGSLFLLGATKTVGLAFVGGLLLYLLFTKKWKQATSMFSVFLGFNALWYLIKRLIWNFESLQFSSQASTLLLKNPYVPSEGKEELMGFIQRFWDNSGIYLSKHFFAFFNLREITDKPSTVMLFVGFILLIVAFINAYKKNKYILFTAFTMLSMLFLSFLVLQKIWDTPRLVVPFLPFLWLFIFAGLYDGPFKKNTRVSKLLMPIILIFLFFSTLGKTLDEQKKDRAGLQAYLAGNKLKGYTPDWVNFIKMSQWAAKNTPDSVMIASRKPSISFLYTGRKFFGIYRIPMHEEHTYFEELKNENIPFVVVDEQKLGKLKLPPNILLPWKQYISGFYAGSLGTSDRSATRFYGVYAITDPRAEELLEILKQKGIEFEDNEVLLAGLEKYKATMMIIKPDELLNQLRDRNARYVIMASLRKYESKKTPYTINTIRRYMFYVQHKYPGILKQVGEVGADEKAILFEVMFERVLGK